MNLFQIVATLLAIVNPFACVPIFVALVKDFSPKRQKIILVRESIFALVLALFLLFIGKPFLNSIHIKQYAVNLSGGTLILLVAIGMIFPKKSKAEAESDEIITKEPFMVPIATPLLTGGGAFAALMALVNQSNTTTVALGIILTWMVVIPVAVASPWLEKLIGKRGLQVLVQIMGMLLIMLAVEILLGGVRELITKNHIALSHPVT